MPYSLPVLVFVNLAHAKGVWEEGLSTEKMPHKIGLRQTYERLVIDDSYARAQPTV